ncbi:MAG: hypothetical protein Q4D16_22460 [Eubacteriales bacterium]|nr:hypothetical protein [Eubacteriales bacterium]
MEEQKKHSSGSEMNEAEIAQISEACREKITQCEKELNKQGFYNIALVAYQMKD